MTLKCNRCGRTKLEKILCGKSKDALHLMSADLSWCVRLLVAGQDLQHHASTGFLQHLLEHLWVVPHFLAIHFLDDVTYMEQTLLVDHAAMEDSGNHQLTALYSKCHSLHTQTVQI